MSGNDESPKNKAIVIATISLVISFASLAITAYFSYQTYQMQLSAQRGNLSIFVETPQYSVTGDEISLIFRGQIRNEGTRALTITTMETGIDYVFENVESKKFQLVTTIKGGFSQTFSWENLTLVEEQTRVLPMSLSYNITSLNLDRTLMTIKPVEGWIKIFYDDGIGVLDQTKVFSIE